jgi:hypothetical protein
MRSFLLLFFKYVFLPFPFFMQYSCYVSILSFFLFFNAAYCGIVVCPVQLSHFLLRSKRSLYS